MNRRDIDERIQRARQAPYHRIFWREDDGAYGGQVLELPGVFGAGDTIENANRDLEAGMEVWIEHELSVGHDIPPPFDPEAFSGRLTFRIPPSLHYRAHLRAQLEGVSLNRLLSTAVALYMGDQAVPQGPPAGGERARELVLREEGGEFATGGAGEDDSDPDPS